MNPFDTQNLTGQDYLSIEYVLRVRENGVLGVKFEGTCTRPLVRRPASMEAAKEDMTEFLRQVYKKIIDGRDFHINVFRVSVKSGEVE